MKFLRIAISALFCVTAALAQAADEMKQPMSIGTGSAGGVYYVLGGGMASVLTTKLGVPTNPEATNASVENLKFIRAGKMDMGFTMADAAYDAYKGEDKFKDGKMNVRTLLALYPNHMQVITLDGKDINKLADLKGKRVGTGPANSGTEVMALRLLKAAGMDKDITRERLPIAQMADALKDGKIDAFFWVSGIPAAAVSDLASTPGMKIKLLDHAEYADVMNKEFGPLYSKSAIPAKSYAGQDKAVANITVWNLLVVDAKMSDNVAYKITKTLFESQPELAKVHKEALNIALQNQGVTSPIPYHPGAAKYLKEKGIAIQ